MFTAAQPMHVRWNAPFRVLAYVLCASLILLADQVETVPYAGYVSHHTHTLSQDVVTPHLPASLTEAPSLLRLTGQRSSTVRSGFSPAGDFLGAISAVAILPAPCIAPFTWNLGSPVLRLPAARGLIAYALPPPYLAS